METKTSNSNSTIFSINKVNFSHEGQYYCQYEESIQGSKFSSPFSNSVGLFVTGKDKSNFPSFMVYSILYNLISKLVIKWKL